uniref:Uncharacterized protein n=1 Tax=Avena sativa TaxID=4498 RepID=A0ACD5VAY6_AVESA
MPTADEIIVVEQPEPTTPPPPRCNATTPPEPIVIPPHDRTEPPTADTEDRGAKVSWLRRLPGDIAKFLRRLPGDTAEFLRGFAVGKNYGYCLWAFIHYFFGYTLFKLVLHFFCCRGMLCCSFLAKWLKVPVAKLSLAKHKNSTQHFFSICLKQLANLWVSVLFFLLLRAILFRPYQVKPILGASIVREFELQSPAAMAMALAASPASPNLRFSLKTFVFLHNKRSIFRIGYDHLSMSVFYADEKLGPADDELPSFKQKPHRTDLLSQVIVGLLPNASSTVVETFVRDKVRERFEMVVRIHVTLTYKFWPFKELYFNIYDCPLSSPVPQIGETFVQSSQTTCKAIKI